MNLPPETAAVLFDFDGTLVLSEARNERAWLRLLRSRGVDPSPDTLAAVMGRRSQDAFTLLRSLHPKLGDSDEALTADLNSLIDSDRTIVPSAPGVGALLPALTIAGVALAVVTSARATAVIPVLERLELRSSFRVIICSEDVVLGKPHPDPYLLACDQLGVRPAQALVVEDSPVGVSSARAAGALVVGVQTTHSATALSSADYVIKDLRDWGTIRWSSVESKCV